MTKCLKQISSGRRCRGKCVKGSRFCWLHGRRSTKSSYAASSSNLCYFGVVSSSVLCGVDLTDAFADQPDLGEEEISDFLDCIKRFSSHTTTNFDTTILNQDVVVNFSSSHGQVVPLGKAVNIDRVVHVKLEITKWDLLESIDVDVHVVSDISLSLDEISKLLPTRQVQVSPSRPRLPSVVCTDAQYNGVKGEDMYAVHTSRSGSKFCIVCDGHGGKYASRFVCDNLPKLISGAQTIDTNTIYQAFCKCDAMLRDSLASQPHAYNEGTTATVVVQVKDIFYVASVGDSGVVFIAENSSPVPLLTKPEGAELLRAPLTAAVNMTSALGDWHLKSREIYDLWCTSFEKKYNKSLKCRPWESGRTQPYVTCDPVVYSIKCPKDFTLVIASDGLYDVINADAILKSVNTSRSNLTADILLDSTLQKCASRYNVSVSNMKLNPTRVIGGKPVRLLDDTTIIVMQVSYS